MSFYVPNPRPSETPFDGRHPEVASPTYTIPLGEAAVTTDERIQYYRKLRAEIDCFPDKELLIAKFSPRFTGPVGSEGRREGNDEQLYDDFQHYGRMLPDGSFPLSGEAGRRVDGIARSFVTDAFEHWETNNRDNNVIASLAYHPDYSMIVYRMTLALPDATGMFRTATYAVPLRASVAQDYMNRVRINRSLADGLFSWSSYADLFREGDGVRRRPAERLAIIDVPATAYLQASNMGRPTPVWEYMEIVECATPAHVIPQRLES